MIWIKRKIKFWVRWKIKGIGYRLLLGLAAGR